MRRYIIAAITLSLASPALLATPARVVSLPLIDGERLNVSVVTDDGRAVVAAKDARRGTTRLFTLRGGGSTSSVVTLPDFAVNRLDVVADPSVERYIAGGHAPSGYTVRVLRRDGAAFSTEWDSARVTRSAGQPPIYDVSSDAKVWASLSRRGRLVTVSVGRIPEYKPFATLAITRERTERTVRCECADEVRVLRTGADGVLVAVLTDGSVKLHEVGRADARVIFLTSAAEPLQHIVATAKTVWAHGGANWYSFDVDRALARPGATVRPDRVVGPAAGDLAALELTPLADGKLLVRSLEGAAGARKQWIEIRRGDRKEVLRREAIGTRRLSAVSPSGRVVLLLPTGSGNSVELLE